MEKKKKLSGYQAYFQGYTQVRVPTRRGGWRTERIYTDPYRVYDLEEEQWKRQKGIIALLTLAAVGFFLWGAFTPTPGNAAGFVAIPTGFSLLSLIFVTAGGAEYVLQPRRLTIYQHTSTRNRLLRWSALAAIGLVVTALATLASLAVLKGEKVLPVLLCAGKYLLSAAASLGIYRLEARTDYREEDNDTPVPFYPDAPF